MGHVQTGIVLRHLHSLLAARDQAERSDAQLLARVARQHDEAAFATLVRRHGPLVLGVCRRVLQDSHAAEDAFQATFLVLFRRARSLRPHGSVANWLYTVAYHAALRARAEAARRRREEREVVSMSHYEPSTEDAWRDLRPVLDEELNRLPDKYRSPVVLCYLEGKTNEEAARLLGWPAGTVKGRLARARALLRSRLTRRGITLSTGLLGILLAEKASAAVPTLLAESTIKTTLLLAAGQAGLTTAPAVALAEGVLQAMFVTKLKIPTVFLLAAGLLALSIGTLGHRVERADSLAAAEPAFPRADKQRPVEAPPTEPKEQMTVRGQVFDAQGNPAPEAQVAVLAEKSHPTRGGDFSADAPAVLDMGKTDAEGRFRLSLPRTSSSSCRKLVVLATVKGHGLSFQSLNPDADQLEAVIKLAAEQVIQGHCHDLQGLPAAGVKIRLAWFGKFGNGESEGVQFWDPPEHFPLWPEPVTTDDEGRFTLHGLDAEQSLLVHVSDDRFAQQWLVIEPNKQKEVTLALAPAQIIEGRVLYEDTGKPVPLARLSVHASELEDYFGAGPGSDGTTDAEGRFRLNPFHGKNFTVTAYGPRGQPYLTRTLQFKWPKGTVKYQVELQLPRGVLIHGKVTEAASGQLVAGTSVQYIPTSDNPNVRPYILTGWEGMELSGPDGVFHMAVLPGQGHLLFSGPTGDYLHEEIGSNRLYDDKPGGQRFYPDALVKLDLASNADSKEVSVTLRRGLTVRGQLLGPDGQPVIRALMFCRLHVESHSLFWQFPTEVLDGRFELPGCDPDKSVLVAFLDPVNQWGATVQLSGKQASDPVTVKLVPCGKVVARFLDADGKPQAHFRPLLEMVLTPGGPRFGRDAGKGLFISDGDVLANLDRHNYWEGPRADADGRCTFPALIPGVTYRYCRRDEEGYAVADKEFTVEAGKTLDLGDLTIKKEK
jgi:RNA polymerase sigma factor (sigma-70 family)